LSGGGRIHLVGGNIASLEDTHGVPLAYDTFINSDNTINGFGVIGSSGLTFPINFQNFGVVNASDPLPLVLKGAVTNHALLENTGQGGLDITGDLVNLGT